jgi:hypothetical protein
MCIRTVHTQLMIWRWPSQNTFGMWTVLYWTRFSRTQFGVSIHVWRLAGDTLKITCNFLYCNHQVHRDFLITLYKQQHNTEYYVSNVFIGMSARWIQVVFIHKTHLILHLKRHTYCVVHIGKSVVHILKISRLTSSFIVRCLLVKVSDIMEVFEMQDFMMAAVCLLHCCST